MKQAVSPQPGARHVVSNAAGQIVSAHADRDDAMDAQAGHDATANARAHREIQGVEARAAQGKASGGFEPHKMGCTCPGCGGNGGDTDGDGDGASDTDGDGC